MIEIWLPNDKKKTVLIVDGCKVHISRKDVDKIYAIVKDYVDISKEIG